MKLRARRPLRPPAPNDIVRQRGDSDGPAEGLGELVHPLGVHAHLEPTHGLAQHGAQDARRVEPRAVLHHDHDLRGTGQLIIKYEIEFHAWKNYVLFLHYTTFSLPPQGLPCPA